MKALIIILSILWVLILILTIIGIYFKITGKDSEDFIKDGRKISKIYEIDDMYMFYIYDKGEDTSNSIRPASYFVASSISKDGISNLRNKVKSQNSLLNRTIGSEDAGNDFFDNVCKNCVIYYSYLDVNKNNSMTFTFDYDNEGKIKGFKYDSDGKNMGFDQSLPEEESKKMEEKYVKMSTDFESKYLSKIKAELSPD
jgi:hypothetical protein